ncbi:TPA: hypothetical protein EYO12_02965 [Candidatus Saccharibacteria bacterium]|nr:hypothetical protein [Candidatus Saccharibacteria bacterium]HIO88001.1 hypothetical protein [Candidatus Saccharibacteria bacterium]
MVIKRSLLAAGFVGTFGLATVAGVSAQSGETLAATLSEKIAEEYNLDQTKIQSLIEATQDEVSEERQAEREAAYATHLEEAVEAGTITEEQKNTLLDFRSEQQVAREALKDIEDEDQRREAHEALREAQQAFKEENSDIPFDELKPEDGEGRRGRGRRGGFGGPGSMDGAVDES